MSAKKKARKQCWNKLENGCYILQSSKLEESSLSIDDGIDTAPYVFNNRFRGEIVIKKPKVEKISDTLCNIIEIHPNTMKLCGMKIGGPVVLSSLDSTFAARVWPNVSLLLDKVAISSKETSLPGFQVGKCIHVIFPVSVSTATLIELSPLMPNEESNYLDSLLTKNHFLKYLIHFLDMSYVVEGQNINVSYFGKFFTLCLNSITPKENETEKLQTSENSISHEINRSISENFNGLSLGKSTRLDLFVTSSTPVKPILNSSQKESTFNNSFVSDCHFSKLNRIFLLTSNTKVVVKYDPPNKNSKNKSLDQSRELPLVTFKDIGGLNEQIQMLCDNVIDPIKNSTLLEVIGMKPMHGLLLYGPPGTGKSLIAKAVANESGCSVLTITGSLVMSKFLGESEAKLRAIFEQAIQQSPCVIMIDEIDSLCPRRDTTRTDAEKRLVNALAAMLDQLNDDSSDVIVVGTTNRIEAIDPALRRSGRFDLELEITIPTASERAEILGKLLSKFTSNVTKSDVDIIADKCHGYVGADLLAICKSAGFNAVKRVNQGHGVNQITVEDLEYGLKQVPPSVMKELTVEVPKVLWKDIGGNAAVKKKIKQAVEWPLKNPEAFIRMGIDPPRGVLLYGPPGCSKTLTAKALATESGLNFISIKGPELFSKYVGDSEKAIRKTFSKARSAAPSIVFIDELDALAIERGTGNTVADRVLATLLTEMDGVEYRKDVIVVAATNRPDMIDKAFLRPGRIDRILYVPLPDSTSRKEIFEINFRKMPIGYDVDLDTLVEETLNYSGAEICAICREAAMDALANDYEASAISKKNFETAFNSVLPQTSSEITNMYEKYEKTLQSRIKI